MKKLITMLLGLAAGVAGADVVEPAAVPDMPTLDVLGKPRLHAGKYDLGAVENQTGGLMIRVK